MPILATALESGAQPLRFYTSGTIRCRSAWTAESAKQVLESKKSVPGLEILNTFGVHGTRDIKKLAEWIQTAKLGKE